MERLIPVGKDNKTQRVVLLRRTRILIWLTLVFFTFNSAIVNGVLASAGGKVKADMHMMNIEYSTFLGFYAIGRICGAFFLKAVIDVSNKKYLLIFTAFMKGGAIFLFTTTPSFPLCMISRLLTGIANAIVSGMIGAWINQFAVPDYKGLMTGIQAIATPCGRSWGLQYEMNFGGPSTWKNCMKLNFL